eukprot:1182614-Prorocentrum_minimum.AAC.2
MLLITKPTPLSLLCHIFSLSLYFRHSTFRNEERARNDGARTNVAPLQRGAQKDGRKRDSEHGHQRGPSGEHDRANVLVAVATQGILYHRVEDD